MGEPRDGNADVPPHARDDAAWFKRHPGRRLRLRPAIDGEWGKPLPAMEPGWRHWTIVYQGPTSYRLRMALVLMGDPPADEDSICGLQLAAFRAAGLEPMDLLPTRGCA